MPALSKIHGALLGAAIGDALGAPFEGVAFDATLAGRLRAHAGAVHSLRYTDDTEMMIGVAESICACGRLDMTHLIRTLRKNYEPARGYGKGMKLIFRALDRGEAVESLGNAAWPEGSYGNGAAVRVVPLACWYLSDPALLTQCATSSARLTHAHPLGIGGCVLHAHAVQQALRSQQGFDRDAFLLQLCGHCPVDAPELRIKLTRVAQLLQRDAPNCDVVSALGNGTSAAESVPLALYSFLKSSADFSSALLCALSFGGDTDSIGAMTGALSGAFAGTEALPARWLEALENPGRKHLEALAVALAERVSPP